MLDDLHIVVQLELLDVVYHILYQIDEHGVTPEHGRE